MVSIPKRFYRATIESNKYNRHPNFAFVLIDTFQESKDSDGNYYDEPFADETQFLLNSSNNYIFYAVYGSYWIDIPKSPIKIAETSNLKEAITIAAEVIGNNIVKVYK